MVDRCVLYEAKARGSEGVHQDSSQEVHLLSQRRPVVSEATCVRATEKQQQRERERKNR